MNHAGLNRRHFDIAMSAAFMMEGLRDVGYSLKSGRIRNLTHKGKPVMGVVSAYDVIIELWGQGCLELVHCLVEAAHEAESMLDIRRMEKGETWGVFEYEVCSPFGEWFGIWILEHEGEGPTSEQVTEKLTELVTAYFDKE